jgi:hypothetical protein
MKEFPYVEDIYDIETSNLHALQNMINRDLSLAEANVVLPDRFETYDKYIKKALKLKDALDLEIEERG